MTAALALAALAVPAAARAAEEVPDAIWVSPTGDDTTLGTKDAPIRSLSLALRAADRVGRRQIYVLPGDHARFRDSTERSATVTVSPAPGEAPPRIAGGEIFGGTDARFEGVAFTDFVQISNHPFRYYAQTSRRIAFEGVTFTSPQPFSGTCLMIRNGSETIRVRDSRFDRCRYGVTGPHDGQSDPARRVRSRDIVVERSWIGPVRTDGFQFTHWEDVTIRGNVIERQHDPAGVDHTDAIQITGDTERIRILDNVISHGGQLVFVQEPFGWNRDITIANNLIYESDNYAVKISSVDGLTIAGNTVWRSRWAALLLRAGVTDAVVANNAIQGYATTGSPQLIHRDGNLIGGDPLFADVAGADFRVGPGSPLVGLARPFVAPDGPLAEPTGTAADGATTSGCSLPRERRVAGRVLALPACGPLDG